MIVPNGFIINYILNNNHLFQQIGGTQIQRINYITKRETKTNITPSAANLYSL